MTAFTHSPRIKPLLVGVTSFEISLPPSVISEALRSSFRRSRTASNATDNVLVAEWQKARDFLLAFAATPALNFFVADLRPDVGPKILRAAGVVRR